MTEQNKVLSPEETEKKMLEEANNEKADPHILDAYAANFKIYHPIAIKKFQALSSKAKDRVMELAIKWPLEDSDKKCLNSEETDVFNTIQQLMISKSMLFIHSFQEEALKQEELKSKQKEGEDNGQSQQS